MILIFLSIIFSYQPSLMNIASLPYLLPYVIFDTTTYNNMHRSGFEPELLAWKAKVIATRPSVR